MPWLILILTIPYLYLILKIWSGLIKIKPFTHVSQPGLSVSVIIACRNEETRLPGLLKDLSDQEYAPEHFEVLIVDDNSSDDTIKTASSWPGIKNLKVIRNDGTGKKAAIKSGIFNSSSDIIITTDADCRLKKKWLSSIASFIIENKPDMVICPVTPESVSGFCGRFRELEFLSLQGVTAGTAGTGNPVMCNGSNLAFTKESYMKNSGKLHDEIISGDDIFLLHALKEVQESKILWLESEDVMVTTAMPATTRAYLRQRARWISKAGNYGDKLTIMLAIVTFVTILLQILLLLAGFLYPVLWFVYLGSLILKSIPDYLIVRNTAIRYKKRKLLWWFIPSAIFYPFYVLMVSAYSLTHRERW